MGDPGEIDAAVRLLVELARTDRIDGIGCRASLAELADRHGPAGEGGPVHERSRWPRWFGYGNLQLEVCRCRVVEMMVVPVWHGQVLDHPAEGVGLSLLRPVLTAAGYTEPPTPKLRSQLLLDRESGGIRTSFVFGATADGFENGPLLDDPELVKVVSHAWHTCP
ncbi:hypothetical protein [Streptacidiphilus jiangxiensis]|uniref:Uncharacterized protein n=1 Tax=Streptacidiphilus jiangxiensis TaxID=235985 RepID=A0A1H7Y126_STRJI|nr:hypothetical protein [Streptacidiphilus jiangxiensis]SEM39683.1 hypothetical protein SAMN05414137_12645 [Streptacidiphilus jiangxiensis]